LVRQIVVFRNSIRLIALGHLVEREDPGHADVLGRWGAFPGEKRDHVPQIGIVVVGYCDPPAQCRTFCSSSPRVTTRAFCGEGAQALVHSGKKFGRLVLVLVQRVADLRHFVGQQGLELMDHVGGGNDAISS
jgi:hypothetical protein